MYEYIATFIIFNKAEPFFLVEPLHLALCQSSTLLSEMFSKTVGSHRGRNKKSRPSCTSLETAIFVTAKRCPTFLRPAVLPFSIVKPANAGYQRFCVTLPSNFFKIKHYFVSVYRLRRLVVRRNIGAKGFSMWNNSRLPHRQGPLLFRSRNDRLR